MATLISELRCSFGWSSTPSELTFSVLDQQGAELTYQINDVRITKSSQDITSLYLTLQFRHTVECSMVKAQTNAKFCELYAGNDPDSKYITTLKGIPIESAKDEFQVEWMDATVKTKVLKLKFISLKKVDPYLMILLLRKFNHGDFSEFGGAGYRLPSDLCTASGIGIQRCESLPSQRKGFRK